MSVIIVGADGQDGTLMTKMLQEKGLKPICINRKNADILIYEEVSSLIQKYNPDAVFYFAAYHKSAMESADDVKNRNYFDVNTIGLVNFMDAIRNHCPTTRVFFASSSLIFKPNSFNRLNENSEVELIELYAISKYAGMKACDYYRNKHGLSIAVGILFNHESCYRDKKFVSKKIIDFVVSVKRGFTGKLVLGDLSTIVDWGSAEDFVEAAYRLICSRKTGDYVIASGEGHTLQQFCEVAFSYAGLNYSEHVSIDEKFLSRVNHTRIGDVSKIKNDIGWVPSTSFQTMIQKMINNQLINL